MADSQDKRGKGQHSVAKHDKGAARRSRVPRVLVGVAVAAVLLAGGAGAWLVWDDSERTSRIPARTVLDGEVDLSGLTYEQACDAVSNRIRFGYSPEVDISIVGKTYAIQLDEVGQVNVDATVARAFEPYTSKTLPQRCLERVRSLFTAYAAQAYDVTTVCDVADSELQEEIRSLASEIDCKPVNAGYKYDDSQKKFVVLDAKEGVKVDKDATYQAVKNALGGSSPKVHVEGVAKITKPKKLKGGQCIYVDTDKCRLHFYVNGKEKLDWPCSPGRYGYETPTGDWTLESKDPSPTWINPHAAWSEGMPETVASSPTSPLGLRALAVSCGGGIFIHGTSNIGALGTRDSHGCVRLSNDNVIKLYDMVKVGIPIIIR